MRWLWSRDLRADGVVRALDGVLRARFLVLGAVLAGWFGYLYSPQVQVGDWWVFECGARVLTGTAGPRVAVPGGPLHLYEQMPRLQVGPPAMVAAMPEALLPPAAGRLLAAGAMVLVLLVCLRLIERLAIAAGADRRRTAATTLIGGLLAGHSWSVLAVSFLHLDDVLVLGLLVGALLGLRHARTVWPAVALGTAAAAKPWAVAFVCLLLAVPRERRMRAVVVFGTAAAAWWAPFVLAAPDTVGQLGSLDVLVNPTTLVGAFLGGIPPAARVVQLVLTVVVGGVLVRRGYWTVAPVAVVAVRLLTDWQWWPYYGASLVLCALLVDQLVPVARGGGPRWRSWPWATTTAVVAAWAPTWVLDAGGPWTLVAVLRGTLLCLAVAVAVRVATATAGRPLPLVPALEEG